ncbi:MAG: glutamyl-tRNA reductase [Planctomycetes bacterium]|nr:glutamyl-tRNA reductase [Planctomycetota bacterium]
MSEHGWNSLFVFGMNHRSAEVDVRERFALSPEGRGRLRGQLAHDEELSSHVLVSTCNRTELFGCLGGKRGGGVTLAGELRTLVFPLLEARYAPYLFEGWEAVFHLFRLASGLDSMVLGESEILRQVKQAAEESREAGMPARILLDLFRQALMVGKRVRTETPLGEGSLSVAATAVKLARKVVGELDDKSALVLGAGETGRLAARHLKSAGVQSLCILNRSVDRAEAAAKELGCEFGGLDGLRSALESVDVVVSAIEAPEPLLTRASLKGLSSRRRCLVDISMPRSIAPDITNHPGVFTFDLDDLASLVDSAKSEREAAMHQADEIIVAEVHKFLAQQTYVELTPMVRELQERWRATVDETLERPALDSSVRDEVERLSKRLLGLGLDVLKRSHRQHHRLEEIRAAYGAFLERTGNS